MHPVVMATVENAYIVSGNLTSSDCWSLRNFVWHFTLTCVAIIVHVHVCHKQSLWCVECIIALRATAIHVHGTVILY